MKLAGIQIVLILGLWMAAKGDDEFNGQATTDGSPDEVEVQGGGVPPPEGLTQGPQGVPVQVPLDQVPLPPQVDPPPHQQPQMDKAPEAVTTNPSEGPQHKFLPFPMPPNGLPELLMGGGPQGPFSSGYLSMAGPGNAGFFQNWQQQQHQQQQPCRAHEECPGQALCYNNACTPATPVQQQPGASSATTTCTADAQCQQGTAFTGCKTGVCLTILIQFGQQLPQQPFPGGGGGASFNSYCTNGGTPVLNQFSYPTQCAANAQQQTTQQGGGASTQTQHQAQLGQSCPTGSMCDNRFNICCSMMPQPIPGQQNWFSSSMWNQRPWPATLYSTNNQFGGYWNQYGQYPGPFGMNQQYQFGQHGPNQFGQNPYQFGGNQGNPYGYPNQFGGGPQNSNQYWQQQNQQQNQFGQYPNQFGGGGQYSNQFGNQFGQQYPNQYGYPPNQSSNQFPNQFNNQYPSQYPNQYAPNQFGGANTNQQPNQFAPTTACYPDEVYTGQTCTWSLNGSTPCPTNASCRSNGACCIAKTNVQQQGK